MERSTRRGVIASSLAVLGASVIYQLSDGQSTPPGKRTETDGGEPTVEPTIDGSEETTNGTTLYVQNALSELPDAPVSPAFGITSEGIFQFLDSESGWEHVQYGSLETPIPLVRATQAVVGTTPSGRPLISNGNATIYVDPNDGDDSAGGSKDDPLKTIQEAVWRVPIYLRDQYTIDLATVPDTPVTYDEDVLVPTVIGTGNAGKEVDAPRAGPFINLVIRGKQSDPGAVKIGSLVFGNMVGTSVGNLYYATLTRSSPYDDERYGLSAYGSGEVKLFDLEFGPGSDNGILAYGANIKASRVDFGDENVDIGVKAKRHASVVMHESKGQTSKDAYRAAANSMLTVTDKSTTTGSPQFNTLRGGLIYDEASDSWIGLSGNSNVSNDDATERSSLQQLTKRAEHPGDATPGDVWYVDGTGDVEEGFYGKTQERTIKFR
jgi:hypothetical protein